MSEIPKTPDHDGFSGAAPADNSAEYKVGYCNPPIEHRFQKGKSGNPRGRPRKKERAYTPRQLRRDVLKVTEAATVIRTEKGKRTISVIEAAYRRVAAKALGGHGPMLRLLIKLHQDSIKEHGEVHDENFSMLERFEKHETFNEDTEISEWSREQINKMRKWTRRH